VRGTDGAVSARCGARNAPLYLQTKLIN